MVISRKVMAALAAGVLTCGHVAAQEADFDLSSQRSESQDVLPVPGKKLDHQGLVINPVPHQLTVDRNTRLDVTGGLRIIDKQEKFAEDFGFIAASKKGVKLTIDFGTKVASRQGVKAVSGAYVLTIDKKGVTIIGYDEQGAFYGIQTLKQIMESPVAAEGNLPYITINDYPDLPNRGVVEGFYGTPWSHEVRMSLIDFYGKFKLNSYLYGPKDDPYHSCPNWRLPYPEKEATNIKELIQACRRNRVNFVWAIHPGQDIKWNEEDYQNLVNKFNWMYDLGVRSFAIFFDDISGEGTNPVKQVELLNRLNTDFVKAKGDVSSLVVCPTDYSKLWANPTPQGSLAIYGNTLDPSVQVFWTGDVVCSDLTKETQDWVNSRIKRPAYFWWNYPVTDYVRHILLQGPVYGLNTSLTANDLCGIASNPMEHGEASKLALYGVADYAWNTANYNALDNWERGLEVLVPQAKDAYRTFAIHSSDTENGYRRDESWETETFRISNYTDTQYQALLKEFEKVEKVPAEMEAGCTNKGLLKELNPWLQEFGKLGTRGKNAMMLIKQYEDGSDNNTFWNKYVENLMSEDDKKAYNAHKSGTMKLQPFYEHAMDDMAYGFYTKLAGKYPKVSRAISSFATIRSTSNKLMFDNDSTTFYTSGTAQKEGDWIGVDLGYVEDVKEVSILQGRNSVDDVDYFDHAVLECSADGKTWTALLPDLDKQYVIHWTGEPVKARYVRLKRLDSKKTNYAAIRSFEVNPAKVEALGFSLETEKPTQALYAFDENPETSYAQEGTLTFEVPQGVTGYTFLMNQSKQTAGITVSQLDKKGNVISELAVKSSYFELKLDKKAVKVQITGTTEIFELIPQCK